MRHTVNSLRRSLGVNVAGAPVPDDVPGQSKELKALSKRLQKAADVAIAALGERDELRLKVRAAEAEDECQALAAVEAGQKPPAPTATSLASQLAKSEDQFERSREAFQRIEREVILEAGRCHQALCSETAEGVMDSLEQVFVQADQLFEQLAAYSAARRRYSDARSTRVPAKLAARGQVGPAVVSFDADSPARVDRERDDFYREALPALLGISGRSFALDGITGREAIVATLLANPPVVDAKPRAEATGGIVKAIQMQPPEFAW